MLYTACKLVYTNCVCSFTFLNINAVHRCTIFIWVFCHLQKKILNLKITVCTRLTLFCRAKYFDEHCVFFDVCGGRKDPARMHNLNSTHYLCSHRGFVNAYAFSTSSLGLKTSKLALVLARRSNGRNANLPVCVEHTGLQLLNWVS